MNRFLRRHRRALAFLLAFLGVLIGLSSVRERPATWDALVVAGDLPAGHVLTDADVQSVPMPQAVQPDSAVTDRTAAVGRVLAGPMAAQELLVDGRLVGPNLLAGSPPDHVALSVRLDDPAEAAFLLPGDTVDVIAASRGSVLADDAAAPATTTVAAAVRVLAIPGVEGAQASGLLGAGGGSSAASGAGTVIVLGVPSRTAAAIAGAAVNSRLSVVMRAS
ncbi:MAG: hypothetical protein QG597_1677 [Actinomycetota bacterium]|nr:hypothetical protein [Actinomycetota bacterium]